MSAEVRDNPAQFFRRFEHKPASGPFRRQRFDLLFELDQFDGIESDRRRAFDGPAIRTIECLRSQIRREIRNRSQAESLRSRRRGTQMGGVRSLHRAAGGNREIGIYRMDRMDARCEQFKRARHTPNAVVNLRRTVE
jgi:hypothetical protein